MNVAKDHANGRWTVQGDQLGLRFRFDISENGDLLSHEIVASKTPEVVNPSFRKGCCGGDNIDDIFQG